MGARAFTGTGSPKQLRKNEKRKQMKNNRFLFQKWQILLNHCRLRHLGQRYRLPEQEQKNRRFQ
jgi:hypothetical protein